MKQFFTILSFATLAFSTASAQNTNAYCDGSRYVDHVFTNVTRTNGVQFGQGTTYCGTAKNLLMDIYEPTGDNATARPVMIVNYGGSFIGGSRTDGYVQNICNDFAKRGYVTCAVDYRLFELCAFPDSTIMIDVVVKAVSDEKAAIRYMREHASQYKIDTNFVFLSGVSAGAILALHTAYIDNTAEVPTFLANTINANGGMTGNSSTNTSYSSSVQGVWSMSGALYRANILDSDDVPLIAIHETLDGTVPYDYGFAKVSGINLISMQGGLRMHNQCDALGKANVFFSVVNAGHTEYLSNPVIMDSLSNSAASVFESILCGSPAPNFTASMPLALSVDNLAAGVAFTVSPNPSEGDMTLNVSNAGKNYDVTVTNAFGQIVYAQNALTSENLTLARTSFPASGMYFVSVKGEGAAVMTQKVVVF